MSVIGSAGSSRAFDNSGSGSTDGLASGAAVAVDYPVGIAFGGHHPNLLLYFCKWGNLVPICITLLLVVLLYWGLVVSGPGALFFGCIWDSSSSSSISRRDWPIFPQLKEVP